MLDINGTRIKVGDTVSTKQPSGGILPSSRAVTGIVEEAVDALGNPTLQIKYKSRNYSFNRYILLKGKINTIKNKL